MKTGIVSVTFRGKSIFDIIAMAKQAGLDAIEIGSDVHAPYDADNLADIAKSAADNGVGIVSYGTYYKLGQYPDAAAEFMSYIKRMVDSVLHVMPDWPLQKEIILLLWIVMTICVKICIQRFLKIIISYH